MVQHFNILTNFSLATSSGKSDPDFSPLFHAESSIGLQTSWERKNLTMLIFLGSCIAECISDQPFVNLSDLSLYSIAIIYKNYTTHNACKYIIIIHTPLYWMSGKRFSPPNISKINSKVAGLGKHFHYI